MTIHLQSISYAPPPDAAIFPFTVPVIRSLTRLTLDSPVTFLVGENGSGKSTLLEAIAAAVGALTVGSEHVDRDPTLDAVRELEHVTITRDFLNNRDAYLRYLLD
ncbi:MAG: AAA family ATPase [Phototrophicaceae bacterium]